MIERKEKRKIEIDMMRFYIFLGNRNSMLKRQQYEDLRDRSFTNGILQLIFARFFIPGGSNEKEQKHKKYKTTYH